MSRHPSAPYGILGVEIAPAMLNTSGGVATDTGGLMLPESTTTLAPNQDAMKTCPDCGLSKPATPEYWHRHRTTKDGLVGLCKPCRSKTRTRDYYRHHESSKAAMRATVATYRKKVFDHYGWSCSCCGETEALFLTIDHINNDGNVQRRKPNGTNLYHWLVQHGLPDDFQTLCRNCNWGKYANGGVCPHAVPARALFEVRPL